MSDVRHLLRVMRESAARYPHRPALRVREHGSWREWTYAQFESDVLALGAALIELGLQPGDRVAIFSDNRPEWSIADFAIMAAGGVSVTIYATSTPAQARHILRDSGARFVVVGSSTQAARVAEVRADLPELAHVIAFEPLADPADLGEAPEQAGLQSYSALIDQGRTLDHQAEIEARVDATDLHAPFTIIYTSGTTGEPKGVMLSHANLNHQIDNVRSRFTYDETDRSLCFLPLSHAFERAWTFVVFEAGASNSYVTDAKTVASYLPDVRPTLMVSVPRLFEKVYELANAKAPSGLKKKIFAASISAGKEARLLIEAGKPLPRELRWRYALARKLVLDTLQTSLGGPKKVLACGGAPLRQVVEEFLFAAGIHVSPGYGLTETSPLVTCNSPGAWRFGSVGKVVDDIEYRLAPDGEFQLKGPNVTAGYWNNPEATAELFTEDGWMRTGDVARIDPDGYVFITDRAKDIIITAQGKNVAPARLEDAMAADPMIDFAAVIGEGRKYLTALIQPNFEAVEAFLASKKVQIPDRPEMVTLDEVKAEVEKRIAAALKDFAGFEQVRKFRLVAKEFTMDSGEVTPTLKLKRSKVAEQHSELVEEMYGEERVS